MNVVPKYDEMEEQHWIVVKWASIFFAVISNLVGILLGFLGANRPLVFFFVIALASIITSLWAAWQISRIRKLPGGPNENKD